MLGLARAAGIAALVCAVIIGASDVEGADGGTALPPAVRSAMMSFVAIGAVAYWTHRLVAAAVAQVLEKPIQAEVDEQLLQAAVKDIVAEQIGAAIEAAMDEVYRLGMVSGAAHVARTPHIVRSREGD